MGAERGFGKAKFVVSLWGIVSILFSAVPLFGAPEKQIKKTTKNIGECTKRS